jgi:TonB family protein
MSTTVTQFGDLRIGVRPAATRPPDPEAWKKMMGQRPVAARLDLLPDAKLSRSALLTSTLFQVAVAAFLVALPMFFPQKLVTQIMYVVTPIAAPDTSVPLPPKHQPVIRAKVQPAPQPIEQPPPPTHVAKLIAPKALVPPKPKPLPVQNQEAPKLDQPLIDAKFDAPAAPGPVRPREPVKTGNLSTTGSAAVATVNLPVDKVQTGGFGDEHGMPGNGDPNKRATIAHVGSPVLPPGPGYGNGTGGANGVRGTVASAGFGNGVAIPPPGGNGGTGSRGTVQSGGFAAAAAGVDAPKAKQAEAVAAVQPVEILAKPNPQYTEEARKLGLEGEVLVQVVFPASGPVQVVRVTKGLGHGLDEAAMRAAEQIKFKPAMQNGQPVDFPATVHIVFQIAY